MYNNVSSELEAGQLERLPELHALSCCLKAVSSADSALGVEICRLACGGHGYMTSSSFPNTYGLTTAMCTYEGENTVMLLQTARYLVKAWQSVVEGRNLTPTVKYLAEAKSLRLTEHITPSTKWVVTALKKVAAGFVIVVNIFKFLLLFYLFL